MILQLILNFRSLTICLFKILYKILKYIKSNIMNLEKLLVCPSKGPFEKASMVD